MRPELESLLERADRCAEALEDNSAIIRALVGHLRHVIRNNEMYVRAIDEHELAFENLQKDFESLKDSFRIIQD